MNRFTVQFPIFVFCESPKIADRGGSSSGDKSRDRSRSRSRDRGGCMTDDDCGGNKVCGSGECVTR